MTAAERFRSLHHADRVLLLPNAWDAASCAAFAAAGALAIATTSAGVAWSCGYPDGDALERESLLFALRSIVRVAGDVPVSADIESGFSDDPAEVARLVDDLCAIGIAGINLEDGTREPQLLAEKIAAVKRAAAARGGDVFVNARTDVVLRDLAEGDAAVRETIARGQRYAAAGADGVFVPALELPEQIARVAEAVDCPLAIMAVPGLQPAVQLYAHGVRRLSAGSALSALAYGEATAAAASFLRDGNVAALFAGRPAGYAETNALFSRDTPRL